MEHITTKKEEEGSPHEGQEISTTQIGAPTTPVDILALEAGEVGREVAIGEPSILPQPQPLPVAQTIRPAWDSVEFTRGYIKRVRDLSSSPRQQAPRMEEGLPFPRVIQPISQSSPGTSVILTQLQRSLAIPGGPWEINAIKVAVVVGVTTNTKILGGNMCVEGDLERILLGGYGSIEGLWDKYDLAHMVMVLEIRRRSNTGLIPGGVYVGPLYVTMTVEGIPDVTAYRVGRTILGKQAPRVICNRADAALTPAEASMHICVQAIVKAVMARPIEPSADTQAACILGLHRSRGEPPYNVMGDLLFFPEAKPETKLVIRTGNDVAWETSESPYVQRGLRVSPSCENVSGTVSSIIETWNMLQGYAKRKPVLPREILNHLDVLERMALEGEFETVG
jgi:hypothetical protein